MLLGVSIFKERRGQSAESITTAFADTPVKQVSLSSYFHLMLGVKLEEYDKDDCTKGWCDLLPRQGKRWAL